MPQAGDDSEESLSPEATTRVWQDPARERDPITADPDILESTAPAERTDLAPGQEVVRGPVASIRTEGGRTVVGEVRLEEADRAARVVVRFHEEEAAARPDHGAERGEHLRAPVEVVEALEDQRRVDRTVRNVRTEIENGRPENLDVVHALGCAPRAERTLHVGYWLGRDHRLRAPGDHRREIAAPRAKVERPTVAIRCPYMLDQRTAWVVVLLGLSITMDLVVVGGPFAGVHRFVEEPVDAVELRQRDLGQKRHLHWMRQNKVEEVVPSADFDQRHRRGPNALPCGRRGSGTAGRARAVGPSREGATR